MELRLYSVLVLTLYQMSLIVGIVLLPVALVVRRFGVSLPIDRLVLALDRAYERSQPD